MEVHLTKHLLLKIACLCLIRAKSCASESIQDFVEQTIKSAFDKDGTPEVKKLIFEQLKLKELEINICVTGYSGVGKSSFINAMRGLSPEDEGAAAVGVIETTKVMKKYQHPENENLFFWDLPGLGTPTFTKENYLQTIKADDKFDYFIIISSDRFTENDLWLGKEMEKLHKAFYFVRSKVGQDVDNNKKSYPKTHNKQAVLDAIRANCKTNLKNVKSLGKRARVYLIDNYDVSQYDFSVLSEHLVEDAPEMKREAMILSLHILSKELILEKKEQLEKRIYQISFMSALAGAVPIPGLDVSVDAFVILEEVLFYRSQFGLDEKSLTNYANLHGMSVDEFIKSAALESSMIQFTKSGVIMYLSKIGVSHAYVYAAKNLLKYTLPIVGNIVSGAAAYTAATHCLNEILKMMVSDALKINSYRIQEG